MTFRELLKKKNVTQEELAVSIGVAQSTISSWSNGITYPRTRNLKKIAKTLGVSVKTLVESFEEK